MGTKRQKSVAIGYRVLTVWFAVLFAACELHAEPAAEDEAPGNRFNIPTGEFNSKTIQVADRALHFVEVAKDLGEVPKPLVVFVHGTPGGWRDQLAFLSSEVLRSAFHMIALDRLGHGESTGDIEPSLQAQAASLKPLLDRAATGQGVILVGHSLGGPIVARTAMDYPEKIIGLVLVASSADPERSRKWYNLVGGVPPVRWFLSRELGRANEEILPLKRELTAMLPLWGSITVPTTIIQGEKDWLVDPRNAEFMRKALVNAPVTMMLEPDADHFVHWRRPQLLIDVLLGFARGEPAPVP